ncbi:MAG: hypothetical protein H7240_02035 [Glaciimonas sp.]|nr:hypothetical protein [Glaciimonas sp.]
MKALDTERRVIYLESLAKSGFHITRVVFVVTNQTIMNGHNRIGLFSDELSKLKSMLTVSTPPVTQALIGGKLLQHNFSLLAANQQEIKMYQNTTWNIF